jgi:hypothetical protein
LFLLPLFKFYENGINVMDWEHCWKHINSPIFDQSRIDIVGFVDLHNVVVRRNAFLALPSAWNGGKSKGGQKSGRLKN